MKKHYNIDAIFIDYFGLIRHPDDRIERWKQMVDISGRLKNLSRELKIAVVSAVQLNRDDDGKRPTLKSLSETKQLECDANDVFFLHRDGAPELNEDKLELIVAKQRDGGTGIFDIVHKKAFSKMIELEKSDYQ
jgi:replicative DNA helicase